MTGFTTFNFGVIAGGGSGRAAPAGVFGGGFFFFAVAGGGGGGGPNPGPCSPAGGGGGGGAAGIVLGNFNLKPGSYPITVGTGGSFGVPGNPSVISGVPTTPVYIEAKGGGSGQFGCPGGNGGGYAPYNCPSRNPNNYGATTQQFLSQTGALGYHNVGYPSKGCANGLTGGAGGQGGAINCGGIGLYSNISGSSVAYGQGGGYKSVNNPPGTVAPSATPGTGNGGHALRPCQTSGGGGGPGIVFISYISPKPVGTGGAISNTTTGLVPGQIMQVHTFNTPGNFNVCNYCASPYPINFLAVAGGGSSGATANPAPRGYAGGGAGGVVVGNTCLVSGKTYNISVGAGGAVGANNGVPTTFLGCCISITALGGGYGSQSCTGNGNPGGSGGGGPQTPSCPNVSLTNSRSGVGLQPTQTQTILGAGSSYTNMGYNGGPGGFSSLGGNPSYGGGGGAGSYGGVGASPTTPGCRYSGAGKGYFWPYTGNGYGGGGSVFAPAAGSMSVCTASGGGACRTPGTPNTGGGGAAYGSSGGPGIMILAVPVAKYPGSASGATVSCAPPAYPGVKLLSYPGPGSYSYTA
jgi:hypothetical protein